MESHNLQLVIIVFINNSFATRGCLILYNKLNENKQTKLIKHWFELSDQLISGYSLSKGVVGPSCVG